MTTKQLFATAALTILISGCYNDNKEELYPDTSSATCDTSGMSFATDIQPIFNGSCALSNCHKTGSSPGGYVLDNYNGVTVAVSSGRLLGSIRHETGYSPMPKNASQLPACEINKIASWVAAGALNN